MDATLATPPGQARADRPRRARGHPLPDERARVDRRMAAIRQHRGLRLLPAPAGGGDHDRARRTTARSDASSRCRDEAARRRTDNRHRRRRDRDGARRAHRHACRDGPAPHGGAGRARPGLARGARRRGLGHRGPEGRLRGIRRDRSSRRGLGAAVAAAAGRRGRSARRARGHAGPLQPQQPRHRRA